MLRAVLRVVPKPAHTLACCGLHDGPSLYRSGNGVHRCCNIADSAGPRWCLGHSPPSFEIAAKADDVSEAALPGGVFQREARLGLDLPQCSPQAQPSQGDVDGRAAFISAVEVR